MNVNEPEPELGRHVKPGIAGCGLLWLCLGACMSGGDYLLSLYPSASGDGPRIEWDLSEPAWPRLPFPNDALARADATTKTGLRVDLPSEATLDDERRLRQALNDLDGFSTYAPIIIPFDSAIDAARVRTVHNDADPFNDALFVIHIDPRSKDYGQAHPLDIGGGRYPLVLQDPSLRFPEAKGASAPSVLFESTNVWAALGPGGDDPERDLIDFYDVANHILYARPLIPLQPTSRYAVVVTSRLVGLVNKAPVESPFAGSNHPTQSAALRLLIEDGLLALHDIAPDDVVFMWSFTTQSTTDELQALRDGLYGQGPWARLAEDYPATLRQVHKVEDARVATNPYVMRTARLLQVLGDPLFGQSLGLSTEQAEPVFELYRAHVDYFVFASIDAPTPFDTGHARSRVPLLCAIPKETATQKQPFPVLWYAHRFAAARLELILYAAAMAQEGLASCAIDHVGHGLPDNPAVRAIVAGTLAQHRLAQIVAPILEGRSQDTNADGTADSGGLWFSGTWLQTRDAIRQSVLDLVAAMRVVSAFGQAPGVDVDVDGEPERAGDFDGNGVADLGAGRPMSLWGIELGGIIATIVGAIEPTLTAVIPVSAGGGLVDIMLRSQSRELQLALYSRVLGPAVLIRPQQGRPDRAEVFLVGSGFSFVPERQELRFAQVPDPLAGAADAVSDGDVLQVTQPGGARAEVVLRVREGSVVPTMVPVAANIGDDLEVELLRQGAMYRRIATFERPPLDAVEAGTLSSGDALALPFAGPGLVRGTERFRHAAWVAQWALDAADPINYAPLYADGTTAMLLIGIAGDQKVPINSTVALGRALGLLSFRQPDPRFGVTQDQLLVNTGVTEGLARLRRLATHPCYPTPGPVLFDVDALDLDPGRDVPQPQTPCVGDGCSACVRRPALRATRTNGDRTSAMRFIYASPTGGHGLDAPNPAKPFDYNTAVLSQIAKYAAAGGGSLVELCPEGGC